MPRHPEILTAITDDVAQFECCPHVVHQQLEKADGSVLLLQQPLFVPRTTESQCRVVERRGSIERELVGQQRAAAIDAFKRETKVSTTRVAQIEGREISLTGGSLSLALYQHRSSRELWLSKSDVLDGGRLSTIAVLKERIANDMYAYYGVVVPRLAMATLPCCYRSSEDQHLYGEEQGLRQASHLLSRWLDRFTTYPGMPDFSATTASERHYLVVNDQRIVERGLGHVLAVAHFIHDIDVINSAGKNIGFRLQVDEQGKLYAQTCKIDPGCGFHDWDSPQSTAYRVTSAMPFATHHQEKQYISFYHLPRTTQQEFIATLADIVDTPPTDLARFFNRKGTEALGHDRFNEKAINMLTLRQKSLCEIFARELAVYKAGRRETKEDKTALPARLVLKEELRPIYAQHLLEQSQPLFQQARFYIEPSTNNDNSVNSKQIPLYERIESFLTDASARVLLLLGNSGFGKSIATQQISRRYWRRYLRNPESSRVSIRIELRQFTNRTVAHCVENVLLDDYHLTAAQIVELKKQPCLIILDGFDEIGDREKVNLWASNRLSEWRDLRLLVTCRSTYLKHSQKVRYFYPAVGGQGFQECYLAPFTTAQIVQYLQKVPGLDPRLISDATPESKKELKQSESILSTINRWTGQLFAKLDEISGENSPLSSFFSHASAARPSVSSSATTVSALSSASIASPIRELKQGNKAGASIAQLLADSPSLPQLLQTPLMLKIFADVLPLLQSRGQDLLQLNPYLLYDLFMQQWFEHSRVRLSQNLGQLLSAAHCQKFLHYSHKLAFELFKSQLLQVDYALPIAPWDKFFGEMDAESISLRSGCPLRRVGNQYSFIHKSFYDFFLAQFIVQLANVSEENLTELIMFLNQRSLCDEAEALLFIQQAEQAGKLSQMAKNKLFTIVKRSAAESVIALASANAATLLNICHVSLSHQSWMGVQLAGADLRYSILAYSDLRNANLRGAKLAHAVLPEADLAGADLRDTIWGEWPSLKLPEAVRAIAQHPQQPWLAVAQGNDIVLLHSRTGQPIGQVFKGHTSLVRSMAFSPDGSLLVSAGLDRMLRLWDLAQQTTLSRLLGGHRGVESVAFSPDGRWVASGGLDNTLLLWDITKRSGMCVPFTGHGAVIWSVAFSPNGQLMASGSGDKTLRLWDIAKRTAFALPFTGHEGYITCVAFSPDSQIVASSSGDMTIRLWDISKQAVLGIPLRGHTDVIWNLAFSPDGRLLASSGDDKTIRLWDVSKQIAIGEPLSGHTDWVRRIAFSSDGEFVISGSIDKTIRLWTVSKQARLAGALDGHADKIKSIAFSQDGRYLVSGSDDKTIRLWQVDKQRLIGLPFSGHTAAVRGVGFSPDDRYIASASHDNTIRLWEVASQKPFGKPMLGHKMWANTVRFSPNGMYLASAGFGDVCLWEVSSQKLVAKLDGHGGRNVQGLAFSGDGRWLISGGNDQTLHLWDVARQRMIGRPFLGHSAWVVSVAFSPDGRLVVSGSVDKTVRLWDRARHVQLGPALQGHTADITAVVFSPNGQRVVSGSYDKTVRLWDVVTASCLSVIKWHQTIHCLAIVAQKFPYLLSGQWAPKVEAREIHAYAFENWLSIGDASGTVSFWGISPVSPKICFLGMPKHNAMPLLLPGAKFTGCQMSAVTKRLLEQYGGEVAGVLEVKEEESKRSRSAGFSADPPAVASVISSASPSLSSVTGFFASSARSESMAIGSLSPSAVAEASRSVSAAPSCSFFASGLSSPGDEKFNSLVAELSSLLALPAALTGPYARLCANRRRALAACTKLTVDQENLVAMRDELRGLLLKPEVLPKTHLLQQAQLLFKNKKYAQASDYLQSLLEYYQHNNQANPDVMRQIYYALGFSQYKLGLLEEAHKFFTEAVLFDDLLVAKGKATYPKCREMLAQCEAALAQQLVFGGK